MAAVRVREAFSCDIDGVPHVFKAGVVLDEGHPAYHGREALFEPVEQYLSRTSAVEQATAAPGERRDLAPVRQRRRSEAAAG